MNEGAVVVLAERLLAALDRGECIALLSAQSGGLPLEPAYAVAQRLAQLRSARGERPVGWKIGFTNRSIWNRYGVPPR